MSMTVTFLALSSQLSLGIVGIRSCVPNSTFLANGALCYCDSAGRWAETDCRVVARRHSCQPGQIIWQGCTQCICQENGRLSCTDVGCSDDIQRPHIRTEIRNRSKGLGVVGPWCTPFTTYYVDCSVCVCPATGRTANSNCVEDTSYTFQGSPTIEELTSTKTPGCLPKVLYLFPCLHCFCTDQGTFAQDKCVNTCKNGDTGEAQNHCVARGLYRKDCNICVCPEDGIPNNDKCTKKSCSDPDVIQSLPRLKSDFATQECQPNSFTKKRCMYCDCQPNGKVNRSACVEHVCIKDVVVEYGIQRETCHSNEIVPICSECVCLRNGTIDTSYCTQACSYQSKIAVLEKLLKDSEANKSLLKPYNVEKKSSKDLCDPGSIYIEDGRYCVCPDQGKTKYKLCTSKIDESAVQRKIREDSDRLVVNNDIDIDFNRTCEPSTFVEFDCNTCYCSKVGKIDPKWCTYDDCKAKKTVKQAQINKTLDGIAQLRVSCTPGSISRRECNLCICPENGQLKDRVCTKTRCTNVDKPLTDKLNCEPLSYYEADCNICICPSDGQKNVAKCTKNLCEKSFLRSDVCIPGELFSDECNVCVCPPNGDKADRACTNHTCPDAASAWENIYKLSHTLIGAQASTDFTRDSELCYPGEQFEEGCNRCVCPSSGFRASATCTNTRCDEEQERRNDDIQLSEYRDDRAEHLRIRRKAEDTDVSDHSDEEGCVNYNLTTSHEAMDCTVGSMYIIRYIHCSEGIDRCRQCLCPYMGNINNFCRPLPKTTYCEQAYPGFNYIHRRDTATENSTSSRNSTKHPRSSKIDAGITHRHTKYQCTHPGKVMDACFICECEEQHKAIIEEHCFRNQSKQCKDARPTFLHEKNKLLVL